MKAATSLLLGMVLWIGTLAEAGTPRPTNRFLIETSGTFPSTLSRLVTRSGGALVSVHPEVGLAVAVSDDSRFSKKMSAQSGISRVTRDLVTKWVPSLEGAAGSLHVFTSSETPPANDPTSAVFYLCQWNMTRIDAAGAWSQGYFGSGIKVAVIDTGSDPSHVDLAGKIDLAESTSFVTDSPCGASDVDTIVDYYFHGTAVSSFVTTNGFGIAGVAPNATLVVVKVLNCAGDGSFTELIEGVLYAANLADVQIINMSLGDYFPKNVKGAGPLVAALSKAVNYATGHGKLFVGSAGNDSVNLDDDGNYVHVPSEVGTAVSIYATTNLDTLASYSNHGVSGTWVGAPGGDYPTAADLPGCVLPSEDQPLVLAACATSICGGSDFYIPVLGTSFATPTAAGVAALVDGKHGGGLSGGRLKTILSQSADDLGDPDVDGIYSHGRVNAAAAVSH